MRNSTYENIFSSVNNLKLENVIRFIVQRTGMQKRSYISDTLNLSQCNRIYILHNDRFKCKNYQLTLRKQTQKMHLYVD